MAKTFDYQALAQVLKLAKSDALFQAIVDAPFAFKLEVARLHLGIIVLLLVNEKSGMIDRVALSRTELAKGASEISVKRFEDIKIPLNFKENKIAQAITTGQPQTTGDWQYLFNPVLTPEEARFNQAGGAIACSVVYPLRGLKPGGALIFSYYQYPDMISQKHQNFMERYAQLVATELRTRQ